MWLDRSGGTQPILAEPGAYAQPRLSPDGRKLGFTRNGDIYGGARHDRAPRQVALLARVLNRGEQGDSCL